MTAIETRLSLGPSRLVSTGLMVVLAAAVLVSGLSTARSLELYGSDFRSQYYQGAEAVLQGDPLYLGADAVNTSSYPYVYPPLTAVALAPVSLVPERGAVVLAVLASVAAVLGALALVGVRDLRCYLAALASAPLWNILETANLTAALVLALALAWRWRSRVWPLAAVLGLAVSAKLLLWPLLVWSGFRRPRAAVYGVVIWATSTLLAWASIGFEGLREFPELAKRLADVWGPESYSLVGVGAALGIESWIGAALALAAGGALLAACFVYARRGRDVAAFTCAVAAALAFTPVVWQHYLLLLLVPLGVARPRFSWLWLLPLATWVSPRTGHGDGIEPFVPGAVAVVLVAALLVERSRTRVPEPA